MTSDAPDAASAPPSQPSEADFIALRAGRTVGRYEITAILGQGGFGITYRARDAQLGRDVAIKEYLPAALAVRQDGVTVMPRSTKTAEDFTWGRQRFVDEGRTLATLQRASAIVRVFDFLETNGTAYIVMELVPGDTLEHRLRQGPLRPDEVDRILWPLLDGLEQVHSAGFLHRDIKPANILLDANGHPTLIDFGAARAAIVGHTSAMTAVFTPGYAAAEQMTSAKQGPWTDIYGLSATLYHSIVGATPPGAFDRMLEDAYRPLATLRPEGFASGLLIGIDAGLAVRATDRPQSIAGWRPILAQASAPDADATVMMGRAPEPPATVVMRPAAPPAPSTPRRKAGLWIALAAVVLLVIGGGAYQFATRPTGPDPAVAEAERLQREAAATEASRQQAAQEELVRFREAEARRKADEEARLKAEADAAMRREIEEETRRTFEAEVKRKAEEARLKAEVDAAMRRQVEEETRRAFAAEAKRKAEEEARLRAEADATMRRQVEDEARRKADNEREAQRQAAERTRLQAEAEAARQKAEEEARRGAEADELALQLTSLDRQHVQVALAALGHDTGTTDGVFGPRTRQILAAWQKSRGDVATGFLSGSQHQALLREAAPALARYEADRKRAEELRKKSDEEKAAAPPAPAPAPPPQTAAVAPPSPPSQGSPRGPGADGLWRGTYHCSPNKTAGDFNMNLQIRVTGGTGTWVRPGSGPGTSGNQSVTIAINGTTVQISRNFVPQNQPGVVNTAQMTARYDGANTISGSGPEKYGGGRTCEISLTR